MEENWKRGGGCYAPIGNFPNEFTAKFDGDRHEIKLTINIVAEDGTAGAGVFGNAIRGEIKNLGVAKGSYISASATGEKSAATAGGIAGGGSYGTISGCYNMGTVTASGATSIVGGIAGGSDFGIIISGCYNTGTVSATTSVIEGMSIAGGIVGGYASKVTVIGCYNMGTVTASGGSASLAGGIAGYTHGAISGCYNMGAVTATGGQFSFAGGIVGCYYEDITISGCYYLAGSAKKEVGGGISGTLKMENVENVAEEQMADLTDDLNEAIEEYKSSAVQTELAAIKKILQLETAPTTLDEAKSKLKTQLEASKKKITDLTQLEKAIAKNENWVAVAGARDDILKGAVELFENAKKMLWLDAAPTTLAEAQTKLEAKKQEIEELLAEINDNNEGTKTDTLLADTKEVLLLAAAPTTLEDAQTKLEAKNKEIEGLLGEIESNKGGDEAKINVLLEKVKQALGLAEADPTTLKDAQKKLGRKNESLNWLLGKVNELLIKAGNDEADAAEMSALLKKANKVLGLAAAPTNLDEAQTKLDEKKQWEEQVIKGPLAQIEKFLTEIGGSEGETAAESLLARIGQFLGLDAAPTTLAEAKAKLEEKEQEITGPLNAINDLITETGGSEGETDVTKMSALLKKANKALGLDAAPTTLAEAQTKLEAKKRAIEGQPQKEKQLAEIKVLINEVENSFSETDEAKMSALLEKVNKALKLSESDAPVDVDEARQRLEEKRQEIESLLTEEKGLLPKIKETLAKIDEFLKLPQTGDEDGKKRMEELKKAILTETKEVLELTAKPSTLAEAQTKLEDRTLKIMEIRKLLNKFKNLSGKDDEINQALAETKNMLGLDVAPNDRQEAEGELNAALSKLTADDDEKEEKMGELLGRVNNLNHWELETNIGEVLKETKEVLGPSAAPTTLSDAKQRLEGQKNKEDDSDKKNKLQQLLWRVEELEIQNSAVECRYKVLQNAKNALGLSTVPEEFYEVKSGLETQLDAERSLIGNVQEEQGVIKLLQTLFENLPADGKVFRPAAGRAPELWWEGQQSQSQWQSGDNLGRTRSSIGGEAGFYKNQSGVVTFKVAPNPGYKISEIVTSGSRIIRPGDVVKALPECVKVRFEKV